ncbi:SPFH domain-containing protein [Streptomyces sp. NPDC056501]|uniref:SPFH domain-containing protein n=1 Tax=Streptomyces sp. NPDC056501 TaxID=3345841 RepID=UPI0036816662
MTASTPTPADSGAAASRDAARTARRLTDGTLPRTSPPTGVEPAPPTTATPPNPTPTGTSADAPIPSGPAAEPLPGGHTSTGSAAEPLPGVPTSTGSVAGTGTGAPVPPGPAAGPPPGAPTSTGPAAGPPPDAPAPSGHVAGTPAGAAASTVPVAGTRTGTPAPSGSVTGAPTADQRAAAPAPAAGPGRASLPEAPGAAARIGDARIGDASPALTPTARAAAPEGGAAPAAPGKASPPEVRRAALASAFDTGSAPATPASSHRAEPLPGSSPEAPAAVSGAEARSATPTPTPTPTPAADAEPTQVSEGDAPAPAPADDRRAPVPPAVAKVSVVKERVDVPDFGRITGARVAALAVPVAGVVRVARRRNVIGAETTGSIPVHLLFRDEPEAGATAPAVNGDDGGPDTVAMAAPVAPAKNGKAAIPAPAKTEQQAQAKTTNRPGGKAQGQSPYPPQTHPQPHPQNHLQDRNQSRAAKARPAPTADPDLVERPGPALAGWVGVAGGALALAGCAAVVWWTGAVPAEAARMLRLPARPYNGIHLGQWALLALGVVATLFALGGLGRGRVGYAWVLTLFGDYRGTVRRTGLVWVSPLLLRRRVDVRLRHWRSEPLPAVDAKGTALDVTVLVVWRVRDTVRAALGVDGHEDYLREQVEAAMARVLSQLPADAFHEDAPTLRDAEAVGEALTRMLSAECAPVGVDVFSAQPTRIEYAPEVAAAMQRRRIAAIDAKHRDSVLTSVVDAVDDVVHRLTSRGLVELDDYERKALVKDLTVAFYTGRTAPAEGA